MMFILALIAIIPSSACTQILIAPNGDSASDGCTTPTTLDNAWTSLQTQGGQGTILFSGGRYFLNNLVLQGYGSMSGVTLKPASEHDDVIIDGTKAISAISTGTWTTTIGSSIKSISVSEDFYQLFEGEKMLMNARWPDVSKHFYDEWDPAYTEAEPGTSWDYTTAWAAFSIVASSSDELTLSIPSLPAFGDLTGATVHFEKCDNALEVDSHTNAGLVVPYDECVTHSPTLYLENHLELLDSKREWVLKDGTLSVWPDVSVNNLRGRVVDRSILINGVTGLTMKDITFFGNYIHATALDGGEFRNVVWKFPSYPKSMLGDFSWPKHLKFEWNPSFYNCKVQYYFGTGLYLKSKAGKTGAVFENNLIEYGGNYLSGKNHYALSIYRFGKAIVRKNTIRYHARGGGIEASRNSDGYSNLYEMNMMSHISLLEWEDVGCIHMMISQQIRVFIARNWFLHSPIIGARFDAPQSWSKPLSELGYLGNVLYNVGYNIWQGVMIKGDRQLTIGNTMANVGKRNGVTVVNEVDQLLTNRNSGTYNNLADVISGARTGVSPATPGYEATNVQGYDIREDLVDADGYDFRLKTDSDLRNYGSLCTEMYTDIPSGVDPCYRAFGQGQNQDGDYSHSEVMDWSFMDNSGRPNVGAYLKDADYWIPGREEEKASFPVPPMGASGVRQAVDLKFRSAFEATQHTVYFGQTSGALAWLADLPAGENIASITTSVIPGDTYYWRVDATVDGETVVGDEWSFTFDAGSVDTTTTTTSTQLPTTTSQVADPTDYCSNSICSDTPPPFMVSSGITCKEDPNLAMRCSRPMFVNRGFCACSCHKLGLYSGPENCALSTEFPTARPSSSPSRSPTTDEPSFAPTRSPSAYCEDSVCGNTPAPWMVADGIDCAGASDNQLRNQCVRPWFIAGGYCKCACHALGVAQTQEDCTISGSYAPTNFPTLDPTEFPTRSPSAYCEDSVCGNRPTPFMEERGMTCTEVPVNNLLNQCTKDWFLQGGYCKCSCHALGAPTTEEDCTVRGTYAPSSPPTSDPTARPTEEPTPTPSQVPTPQPTNLPTRSPSAYCENSVCGNRPSPYMEENGMTCADVPVQNLMNQCTRPWFLEGGYCKCACHAIGAPTTSEDCTEQGTYAPTNMPTLQPTHLPTRSPSAYCENSICGNEPTPQMVTRGVTCATILEEVLLSQCTKPYWRNNGYCKCACSTLGLAYDDEDCTIPDNSFENAMMG